MNSDKRKISVPPQGGFVIVALPKITLDIFLIA